MKKQKYIGYDTCPDCEGSGGVTTDTADLYCPSCEGTGYVAFNSKEYIAYNKDEKKIGIKTVKWIKQVLPIRSYIEEGLTE